jgi:hypothetical protein
VKNWDQNDKHLYVLIYENCENAKSQGEKDYISGQLSHSKIESQLVTHFLKYRMIIILKRCH